MKPSNRHHRRPAELVQRDLQELVLSGVTVTDIARVAGLHPQTVSEVNRGRKKTFSVYTVGRILEALEQIERGEVEVVRHPKKKAAVQSRGEEVCSRGHLRSLYTTYPASGAQRYCRRCRAFNKQERAKRSSASGSDITPISS